MCSNNCCGCSRNSLTYFIWLFNWKTCKPFWKLHVVFSNCCYSRILLCFWTLVLLLCFSICIFSSFKLFYILGSKNGSVKKPNIFILPQCIKSFQLSPTLFNSTAIEPWKNVEWHKNQKRELYPIKLNSNAAMMVTFVLRGGVWWRWSPEVVLNFPLFCTRSLSLSVFPWKRDFRSNLCWLLRRMAVLRGNRYDYGKLWGLWESICGSGVTLKRERRRTMQIGCIFRKDELELFSWKRMLYFEGGKILCYSLDFVFPLKIITKLNWIL